MNSKILSACFLCLLLAACAGFKAVDADKPVNVGDDITIQPQVAWANAFGPGISGTVWTIDGLGLNELRFLTGIVPGRPLLDVQGVPRAELVGYNATMLPNDVMDMTVSTLGKLGNQQVRAAALRPAPFGAASGFRFDLAFATKDGLEMKGIALASQRRGKLDVILYIAPAEFYYDRNVQVVERIFASIKVPDTAQMAAATN
jgi:hypothetical protein